MKKNVLVTTTMLLILTFNKVLVASPYYVFASYMNIKNSSSQNLTCSCNGGYGATKIVNLSANSPPQSFSFDTITGSTIGFCGNIDGSALTINCYCYPYGSSPTSSNLVMFSIANACASSTSTTCTNGSASATPGGASSSSSLAAYTCSPSTTCSVEDKTETNYFCGGEHSYKKCSAHGDLVIQDVKTIHYTLEWKNVFVNLVKGQVMANKLAKDLFANVTASSTQVTLESASYSNNTVKIVAVSSLGLTSPFAEATTASQCDDAVVSS